MLMIVIGWLKMCSVQTVESLLVKSHEGYRPHAHTQTTYKRIQSIFDDTALVWMFWLLRVYLANLFSLR